MVYFRPLTSENHYLDGAPNLKIEYLSTALRYVMVIKCMLNTRL